MTNQVRGVVSAEIGGKRYKLRLSANEWCELEDEFGQTTDEILKWFFEDLNAGRLKMKVLRIIFRACLSGSHPDITLEEAGSIMADNGLVESAKMIGEAIMLSMPKPDASGSATMGKGSPGKPRAPRGRR